MDNIKQFVYGRNETEKVINLEIDDNVATLFLADGTKKIAPNEFYAIHKTQIEPDMITLYGDLDYKFVKKFQTYREFQEHLSIARAKESDVYAIWNPKEAFMIKSGVTHYKGMKPKDLRTLSFDIETTGLDPSNNQILMFSNTFRYPDGRIDTRLFSIDEFNNEQEMIYAWFSYVEQCDPDVILGHNILGFDLPFIKARASKMPIGRDRKDAKFSKRPSQFRKDGSQSYDYFNVLVYGREVIDTFHLAIKYDVARNYPTYKLKDIIKYEGLEKKDRTFVNFEEKSARKRYEHFKNGDTENWEKFKSYAKDDAADALALWDLMIPAYFYFCQSIPKTLQQVVNGATGSQVNSFMVRAYLANKHSIPKASEAVHFEGADVEGNPGIYNNVGKYDVASLYPSIILQERIYDKIKDPKGYFLKMVEYFTTERLSNKRLSKETGDRYYKDLEQAQKIVINSAYGFLGAPGLNFNSPANAASVTRHGRAILQRGIEWARSRGWTIVNADTDSFSFTTGSKFDNETFKMWLKELNSLYPDKIRWEDDGVYETVIVVKEKNYVLKSAEDGKVKIKGSGLKATMKEPALREFIDKIIDLLLKGDTNALRECYDNFARECFRINASTITRWCSKKTVTKAVLNPKRTNEARIKQSIEAAGVKVQEGDKIYVFFRDETTLAVAESFDGVYDKRKLLGKLYNTIKVFDKVVPIDQFTKYQNKKQYKELEMSI